MQTIPEQYAGQADPGDEAAHRHATRLEPKLWLRASVYPFGVRWHWKCGPKDANPGLCEGGPAKTQEEAYAKAETHLRTEHDLTFRVHDGANCWCGDEEW
ncbi:hypothetical protein AB0F72_08520 [Actinoplanes sp. NPDC023936]|uniref:hypothetical protein n=1 Tax=Actinoplanes sp. NPDC023936 TaxID=3154910 RepID=UPI003409D062